MSTTTPAVDLAQNTIRDIKEAIRPAINLAYPIKDTIIDDDEWVPTSAESLVLQVIFVLVVLLIIFVCTHDQNHVSEISYHDEDTKYSRNPEGYRNYIEPGTKETIYPGNPSKYYSVMDVPHLTLERLNMFDGKQKNEKENDDKNLKAYIAIGGKIFDITNARNLSFRFHQGKIDELYGKDISLAAISNKYDEKTINLPFNPNDTWTPEQRQEFFSVYNMLYENYPIVGLLQGEEKYTKFIRTRGKFEKSNYYW